MSILTVTMSTGQWSRKAPREACHYGGKEIDRWDRCTCEHTSSGFNSNNTISWCDAFICSYLGESQLRLAPALGSIIHDHQWVGYITFRTTWYKTWYPTYAPVADWRYAGIQLLFITPKRGRLIYPDRISLQDLVVPTLLCTRAHAADSFTNLSAR